MPISGHSLGRVKTSRLPLRTRKAHAWERPEGRTLRRMPRAGCVFYSGAAISEDAYVPAYAQELDLPSLIREP